MWGSSQQEDLLQQIAQGTGVSIPAEDLTAQPGLLGGTNINAQAALQNIAADNAQQTQAAQSAGMQAMQQAQAEEAQRQQMLLKLAVHFFGV